MTRTDRIIMMKRETPKRVTQPNGRTFVVKYKRVTRAHLPANIRQDNLTNKQQCHEVDIVDKQLPNKGMVLVAIF